MKIRTGFNPFTRVFMNKAGDDKSAGGAPVGRDVLFAGSDDSWDMSNVGFIDDNQDIANLSNSDITQPDLNNVNYDEEEPDDLDDTDTELDETEDDGTDSDDDTEEDDDSDDDDDTEEDDDSDDDDDVEEDDDSDDDSDDSDDDAEEDDSAEEVEEPAKKAAKEQPKYVAEIRRLRARAQTAEASFAKLHAAVTKGGDSSAEIDKLEEELDALEDQREEALLDADKETAAKLRKEIRALNTKVMNAKFATSSKLQTDMSTAKQEVQNAFEETIALVNKRYPQLDNNSPEGNGTMINMVNSLIEQKRGTGKGLIESIVEAVDEGALILKLEPQDEAPASRKNPETVKKQRTKKAVTKRIDAVKKAKRRKGSARKPEQAVNVSRVDKLPEAAFASKDGREALEKEYGIKFSE